MGFEVHGPLAQQRGGLVVADAVLALDALNVHARQILQALLQLGLVVDGDVAAGVVQVATVV